MADDKIVPFGKPKAYMSGAAKCLSCKHEWIAVTPEGVVWMECPACGMDMGRRMGPIANKGEGYYWHCNCGNDLFNVTPEGSLCPVCGVVQRGT